ncbi:MAG: hypothetical protein VX656_11630 [Candidatus Latescibacterota bacterium]|nr:hypothetical protein [Candidatus Latescibacterota bacterium]
MSHSELPFGRRNWILFGASLAVIGLGYVLLSIPPADGFLSLTAAPILLVGGYCVLLPAAILVRDTKVAATTVGVDEDAASG